ncbi:MAG: dihydropteroate synthase [Armatimonadota bacterium]|nr:dihydropteroate synthase [Armatimonadota bacterium]MDR7440136.1 dihydropteroate synthase [Armatimonadota bacterium]MDR7562934.1 dihydropteroate synthase [Armatimonadota bacterium]MDR7601428.1 dihydropteroate synthase [Armatimonadota bacterium]
MEPRTVLLRLRDVVLDLGRRVYVVGVLNVTPDSFYVRARHPDPEAALARAHEMAREGADLIEVGGESARPGAPVSASTEIERVVPILLRIREEVKLPVIVETTKFEVAREALHAGAVAINDVSGLADPRLADLAAEFGAGLVILHRRGPHKVPHPDLRYGDVVAEVRGFLARKAEFACSRGVPRDGILLDPGFSFDKQPRHDVALLLRLPELLALGYPVYLATSRKNYLRDLVGLPPEELLEATAAAVVLGIERGARVIRTHDVRFMVRIARTMEALLGLAQAAQVDAPAAE